VVINLETRVSLFLLAHIQGSRVRSCREVPLCIRREEDRSGMENSAYIRDLRSVKALLA